jgi:2-polyprenyl-6-hydroxyphenyl methylase/3-demethylubiquinone-9 3-methyltransferase
VGSPLQTRPARDHADVAAFFDACAAGYADRHGDPDRLLHYHLSLLRAVARLRPDDVVLEIGCGTGLHLLALADEYGRGLGVDLAPAMVEAARGRRGRHAATVEFAVDAAERLATVADGSVDVVLAVGALEHMLDQAAVCRNACRVLRPGGRFVCLTPNGGGLWYRRLAPALGLDTRQLATDHYRSRRELTRLLRAAGFGTVALGYWTFVQRGDMPPALAALMAALDRLGRLLRLGFLRGGLRALAVKEDLIA